MQVALNGAAGPLQQYLRLANRMESRLTKLENNQSKFHPSPPSQHLDHVFSSLFSSTIPSSTSYFGHSQTAALSNQDLYELVQDAHNATLHFSTLKQEIRPLIRLLEENYSALVEGYKSDRTKCATTGAIRVCVFAAVAIFWWWNPAGWVAVGAYGLGGAAGGVGGGVAGAGAHKVWDIERGKAFGKKDRVRECKISLPSNFPILKLYVNHHVTKLHGYQYQYESMPIIHEL